MISGKFFSTLLVKYHNLLWLQTIITLQVCKLFVCSYCYCITEVVAFFTITLNTALSCDHAVLHIESHIVQH